MSINKDNGRFLTVSTKVDANTWRIFQEMCDRLDLSPYQLLQMVVDTLIRMADDKHNLTPTMETLIHTFENLTGWKDAFNLADPTSDPEIGEATYYLSDKNPKLKGTRAVMVERPFCGTPVFTYNVQRIAERMFCLVFPQMYKRLRGAAVELDTQSVIETIEKLLQEHGENEDDAMLRELFSDNERSEFGRNGVDEPYVRHLNRQMELFGYSEQPAEEESEDQFNNEEHEQGQELQEADNIDQMEHDESETFD